MSDETKTSQPWTRVLILLGSLLAICLLSRNITGLWIPNDTEDAVIFQNALLLIVIGSALLEAKFTKPADSAINGLMGMLTLIPIYGLPTPALWWLLFSYCIVVSVLAMTCVAVSSGPALFGWRAKVANVTHRPAVIFGKARVLYSVIFLYSVFSFYGVTSPATAKLVVFWGVFLALWPLRVPDMLSAFRAKRCGYSIVGQVVRTDAPNVIHVTLHGEVKWNLEKVFILQQSNGQQSHVVPLYEQLKEQQTLATGLCIPMTEPIMKGLDSGCLYEWVEPTKTSLELLGGDAGSKLLGFVDVDSTIGQLKFHTWDPGPCYEGMLVWSRAGDKRIYYQIAEGHTKEEGLESNKHGYQLAEASQLGVLDESRGFLKYPWLPAMNTPVFSVPKDFGTDAIKLTGKEFVYGTIPGTEINIAGDFADMMEYHTAIIGVTGAGKTELAFDLLRHAIDKGTKVICIDLTSRYEGKLADLKPHDLSISPELAVDLGAKLFEAETGAYGGGAEKKVLKGFADKLRESVTRSLADFLTSKDGDKRLGIIRLDEISNTKASIFITEVYLTALLHFARDNADTCPRVLLVVEEAHTVMPETGGVGDFDSKGLVAKIAQIALQGRKYGIGLLVIAQRTANVSKTVLTQCNTIIAFTCFDATNLAFFENFFGKTHTETIPNLQFLQAVAFGKGVKSQRPVIVNIPFNEAKK
ncbi:MAG TPA: DUF87 domain-containing protein [Opitutaceae bacterium]|nr:DUF87 domain-containing protein [Opitutaceae bacterium]HRJ46110.1 DUF87 domain-containing protein [Opitutaceae bacterium]